MLDHWQIGDEVTLAGPLGEFVYLPVRDGKTVIVFPSARIASICGSNSLILVYFLDITKPPRVVLLSYTGRLFVYFLLFMDWFNFTPLRRFMQLLGWLQKMLDNTSSKMVMSGVC